jgi:cupin fold WbuC family metalloprotein
MHESSTVLLAKQPIDTVSQEIIEKLKKMARDAPLKRARLCLHASHQDAVQEMVIALHESTYIRPHRHPGKTESFHMIEGSVLIGFFNDRGEIVQTLRLDADHKAKFLYRLSAAFWHAVLPLTEFAVFQEVANGPFSGSEFPEWEPKEAPEEIEKFKEQMKSHFLRTTACCN